jgi:ABC-type multidrug transport system ATPase subunit
MSATPAARGTRLRGRVVAPCGRDVARRMAYVPQKQSFYPFLTVRETLLFTAGMRLADSGDSAKVRRALLRR